MEIDWVDKLVAQLDVDQKLLLIGRIWESIDLEEVPVCGWHVGSAEGSAECIPPHSDFS